MRARVGLHLLISLASATPAAGIGAQALGIGSIFDSLRTSAPVAGAEVVKVEFRPAQLPFERLLTDWYFRMHDPTTLNRQGNDDGPQYRSAIFFTTPAQGETARAVKARVDAGRAWKKPVVTEVTPASAYTRAEEHHQDYLQRNPGGYTCHYLRELEI